MKLLHSAVTLLLGTPADDHAFPQGPSLPRGVTVRRGRLIPRIGGLLLRSRRPAAAVALRRTIIVDPEGHLTPDLLAHELEHVRQWADDPLFPIRYTLATLRHGYRNNPYEVEARAAAERHSGSMKG